MYNSCKIYYYLTMKQINNFLKICYNKQLFVSSTLMVIGNVPYILVSTNLVKYYYALGLLTSILNHSLYDNQFMKLQFRILDRSVMVFGALIDVYLIKNKEELYLLQIAIFCYFLSKVTKLKFFHILSHYYVTILHNSLLNYSTSSKFCYISSTC